MIREIVKYRLSGREKREKARLTVMPKLAEQLKIIELFRYIDYTDCLFVYLWKNVMQDEKVKLWDGVERRLLTCRRSGVERRISAERRCQRGVLFRKRSLKAWVRTLTNPRLGVDRRSGVEQRSDLRRDIKIKTLLTQDELIEILK